jgi:hypothetical protein
MAGYSRRRVNGHACIIPPVQAEWITNYRRPEKQSARIILHSLGQKMF